MGTVMRTNTRIDWHGKVEKAIGKIMQTLDEPVHFKEIANEVYASPYHFHRMFRELTGESVYGCIKRLRLERAMVILRNTHETITDIALDSGYQTLESFLKAFREAYGMKPSDARKFKNWDGLLYSKAGLHYDERKKSHWFYLSSHPPWLCPDNKVMKIPPGWLFDLEFLAKSIF
jgi:AraC family transcriptional regulator